MLHVSGGKTNRIEASGPPTAEFELPVEGFTGTPREIEQQWFEKVYKGRGDSMRQLTWRAVLMFIANKQSVKDPWKKHKMDNLIMLLEGAMRAQEKVGLKMNVEKKNLQKVLSLLPAMKKPTIANLTDKNWLDVETIIDEAVVRELIPALKKAGASGIIEYPLNKVIP